jgi:drug/metabolite transporter (DMT)-like permease
VWVRNHGVVSGDAIDRGRLEVDWKNLSPGLTRDGRQLTWGSMVACVLISVEATFAIAKSSAVLGVLAVLAGVMLCAFAALASRRLRDRAKAEAAAAAGVPVTAVVRHARSRTWKWAMAGWSALNLAAVLVIALR